MEMWHQDAARMVVLASRTQLHAHVVALRTPPPNVEELVALQHEQKSAGHRSVSGSGGGSSGGGLSAHEVKPLGHEEALFFAEHERSATRASARQQSARAFHPPILLPDTGSK